MNPLAHIIQLLILVTHFSLFHDNCVSYAKKMFLWIE